MQKMDWQRIDDAIQEYYPGLDTTGLRVLTAVVLTSVFRDKYPIHFAYIKPPSGGGDTLVSILKDLTLKGYTKDPWKLVHIEDEISDAGFQDLLSGINGRNLVWPDLSTFTSQSDPKLLMAKARASWTGRYHRTTAKEERSVDWEGFFNLIIISTGAIDRESDLLNQLGNRLLARRPPKMSKEEQIRALHRIARGSQTADDDKQIGTILQEEVDKLDHSDFFNVEISVDLVNRIGEVFYAVEILRQGYALPKFWRQGDVPKDEPEAAYLMRSGGQAIKLAKSLAWMDGRSTVEEEDVDLAIDCMKATVPALRYRVVESILQTPKSAIYISDFAAGEPGRYSWESMAAKLRMPVLVIQSIIDELTMLSIVIRGRGEEVEEGAVDMTTEEVIRLNEDVVKALKPVREIVFPEAIRSLMPYLRQILEVGDEVPDNEVFEQATEEQFDEAIDLRLRPTPQDVMEEGNEVEKGSAGGICIECGEEFKPTERMDHEPPLCRHCGRHTVHPEDHGTGECVAAEGGE